MKYLLSKVLQSISLWWRLAGSNRWPPACKAGALPAELNPHIFQIIVNCQLSILNLEMVGQNGLEPSTSRLSVVCSSQLSYWPILFPLFQVLLTVPSKLNNALTHLLSLVLTLGHYKQLHRVTWSLLRKEVIQPHLPIRLPCYDFTPITGPTFGRALLAVRLRTSGVPDSHGVTGGVYKARERIHRGMLIRDY